MDEGTESAFAGYRFHRVLGETTGGGSFEATEVATGDSVVIESLIGADADDPAVREWFTEAWDALAQLEHQNLPEVRSTGHQGEVPFAVRSTVEGRRLPGFLASDHGLDPASIRILIARLADGLDQAHEAGVIHGALGPGELIVGSEPGGEVIGSWVGFGRAEGSRSDDVLAIGGVLEALLDAERAAHDGRAAAEAGEPEDGEPDGEGVGRSPMDAAILAMLNDVAARIRDGSFQTAGEVRDVVAAGSEPRGWAPGRRAFALLAALAVVAVVVLLITGGEEDDPAPATGTSSSSSAVTTASSEPGAPSAASPPPPEPIEVAGSPRSLAIRDGVIQVVTSASEELAGYDEATGAADSGPVKLEGEPGEVTVVDGVAFVTLPQDDRLARVDLADERPNPELIDVGQEPGGLIGADGSIWVVNELSGDLSRVDPAGAGAESVSIGAQTPRGIAFGLGSLWVTDESSGAVLRVDPEDPSPGVRFEAGSTPTAIIVTDGRIWVANESVGVVTAIEPDSGETKEFAVGGTPVDIAADPERIWVANLEGYVSTIEFETEALERIDVPRKLGAPVSIAVGDGVWAATGEGDSLVPVG